jgi:peptide-methionine (S)-S-oxide reductase
MQIKRTLCAIFTAAFIVILGVLPSAQASEKGLKIAIFAGGCFWCVESDFDNVTGVEKTISGYIGGSLKNPTYQQVSRGNTGHREALQIFYDPKKVTYKKLLDVFWRSVDPTDAGGQFCDRGFIYSTAVYATTNDERKIAEASKQAINESGVLKKPIATAIETAGKFYPAEDYHQDYYKRNPIRYKLYRFNCGRDRTVSAVWGKEAHKGINKH